MFMRNTTIEDHYIRLKKALDLVLRRLDRPCKVEEVAAEAGFSRFHCQRIFRSMTGESIAELVRRLRLERAAYRLRHEQVNVIDVALDVGYGSEASFSRAFRRGYGMSPGRYRTVRSPPAYRSTATRVRYHPEEHRIDIDILTGGIEMEVRIEKFDDTKVARIRHVGPYDEVGPSFERLFEWAASTGAQPGRVFTLSYDDPDDVASQSLRSDVCVELRTDVAPPSDILLEEFGAGRYAVYTLEGPYEGIAAAYKELFGSWLPQSGEELDDRPCMEIYHNSPMDTPPAKLVTDLCLPLRAR